MSGDVSYEKVRDGIEKDLGISDITATDLQEEIKVPIFLEEYRKKYQKNSKKVNISIFQQIIIVIFFKILKVFSEQNLIWLKMKVDWF